VNTGRFAIDDACPTNSQMIGYEEWLFESYQVAKDGSKHPDVYVRLRSKAAQKALQNELIIITELKSVEWKRQLRAKRKTKNMTLSDNVIECGEFRV